MVWDTVVKVLLLIGIGFLLIQMIKIMGKAFLLIINTVLGLAALFFSVHILGLQIPINFWSVLLSAMGGLVGFLIVLLLHIGGWIF
ncbi:MAG: hypothetical protein ABIA93_06685 [Candidatus Woesearchaeota archaeon]